MRLGQLALLLGLVQGSAALWPFKPKRFTAEAFIDAGPLGLDDAVRGRVLAIGDINGDQNSDLFVLDQDGKTVHLYLWQRDNFKYTHASSIAFPHDVVNVVPADFNGDGRLDLLAMMTEGANGGGWWGTPGAMRTDMRVVLGGPGGLDSGTGDVWDLDPATEAQPIVFDDDGSLRASLLGYVKTDEGPALRSWRNNGTAITLSRSMLWPDENVCQLALPHSSAFVDIDGDCQPDLVLHCRHARANEGSLQVWLAKGESGYVMSKRIDLPSGSRAVTFADMNRDGALDLVFASCKKTIPSTGVGTGCSINIAYNVQAGVCSSETSRYDSHGRLGCRGWGELCKSDPAFNFDTDPESDYFTSIPITDLFPGDDVQLLVSAPGTKDIPLPPRAGDFDVDGFPDLLVTVKSGYDTKVKVLHNVPCGKGVPGCTNAPKGARGLVVGGGKGWDALDRITDATGASWIDLDDDGSLDIMVQRSGKQDKERVTFIQNNFYHDAFFLKAQVLNGACEGTSCDPSDGGKSYSGRGASYSGASFKFTVFDTGGTRHAQQVPQLPQTCYHALHSPHTFIGLGRTNNYIENFFAGTSAWEDSTTQLESLIPNSQVIINPPWPAKADEPSPPVTQRSKEWRVELFLHPGDWVPWVALAVAVTVVVLGIVVMWLGEREKREDETERRRALHAINFQAL